MTQRRRWVPIALFVFTQMAWGQIEADDKNADKPITVTSNGAQSQVLAYRSSRMSASQLAESLRPLFTEADRVQISVDPDGELLLMEMPTSIRRKMLRFLDELDCPPRRLVIEVLRIRTLNPLKDFNQLSGPSRDVRQAISNMERRRLGYVAERLELSVSEDQEAALVMGGQAGSLLTGTLTSLRVAPQIAADGRVILQLELLFASAGRRTSLRTTVRTGEGQSALVDSIAEQSDNGSQRGTMEQEYLVLQVKADTAKGHASSMRQIHPRPSWMVAVKTAPARKANPPIAARKLDSASTPGKTQPSRTDSLNARSKAKYMAYFAKVIEKHDTNNDGVLTQDEWSKMSKDPAAADANGDKQITVDEYARWAIK